MNVNMQACPVGNERYLFVNTQRANPSIKTVSRFFEYKTWTDQIWRTEIIENGNAFFHWQGHDIKNGHRDTIINYLLNGQRWQSTIEDYIFFHALEGKVLQGHYDNIIEYVSSDNYVYQSAFAEYITDQIHQRAPNGTRF
ncbi:DUF4751 domain-containing protein [Salmonella enterica]|nr:DUF4751 domain-containing protein [Salmonella enterica]ECR4117265.1 DUF4751 domain-containing protein [Salmonella enterica]EIX1003897.1 DUF4751 family protein [Salmonella enterica]EIX1017595.1 DUF4751 family protein [Salmonella enterica]EIX8521810.1 DUF4751 family protein [Salmonella enterica]